MPIAKAAELAGFLGLVVLLVVLVAFAMLFGAVWLWASWYVSSFSSSTAWFLVVLPAFFLSFPAFAMKALLDRAGQDEPAFLDAEGV